MTDGSPDETDSRYHLEAADRTIKLLTAVGDNSPITIVGLTTALGWSKPMVYRLVRTLHSAGALVQSEGGYSLGPMMISLGYAALRSVRLVDRARPFLLAMHEQTGETVVLTVLDGRDIVYVDFVETDHLMVFRAHIGTRLPAYRTASGHALLSGHSREALTKLYAGFEFPPSDSRAVASVDDLVERTSKVAASGFSLIDEELTPGHRAAASPIVDHRGAVAAAVSLSVPAARVSLDALEAMARESLVPQAALLSAQLGYRAPQ